MRTIIISEPGKVAVTENEMPKVKEGEALLKLLLSSLYITHSLHFVLFFGM